MDSKKLEHDQAARDEAEEARMTFTEHLAELRTRIVRSGFAIVIGFVICYLMSEQIFYIVSRPLRPVESAAKAVQVANLEGIYLAQVGNDGKRLWDSVLGDLLKDAKPVAFQGLSNGGEVIVANQPLTDDKSEGLLIVTKPDTEKKGKGQKLVSVQSWNGVTFSDVRAKPGGGFTLLGRRDVTDPKAANVVITNLYGNGKVEGKLPKDMAKSNGAGNRPMWTVLSPLEPVIVNLKLAAYGGLLLAFPYILWQICAFIFPGLKPNERKLAKILIFGCSGFSIAGALVAYFGIFPLVLPYLLQWTPQGVLVQFRMNETVSLMIKGLLAFALAFQMPMVVLALVYLDLLSPETLTRYRRVAIVGIAVMAAVLTPPDPGSMVLMGVPLLLLYEVSILMAKLVVRARRRKEASA